MENQEWKAFPEHRRTLLEAAKAASLQPGVYLMKSVEGTVLYVGKAKSLKNRLVSYFQSSQHEIPRIEMLVNRIDLFEVILTQTESEALILEVTLIKKYRPKFNIRLKDDKNYPYLRIKAHTAFPRIEWSRRVLRDGARYFGPFPSALAARQVMGLLTDYFQLRDCSENTFAHRSRPCILYQMKKCSAPCVGKIDAEGYGSSIQAAMGELEGRTQMLVDLLTVEMEEAADQEQFEVAADYRDQILNFKLVTQTQGVDDASAAAHFDVIHLARAEEWAQISLLQIRVGKMSGVRHFQVQNSDASCSDGQVLRDFLTQYYLTPTAKSGAEASAGHRAEAEAAPEGGVAEILLPFLPDEHEVLQEVLQIRLRVLPQEGAEAAGGAGLDAPQQLKLQQLLNVAHVNAQHSLQQAKKKASGASWAGLEEIQTKLQLSKFPQRMECYDISNIQGQDAVASRVVFIDGVAEKSLYRRYKIKTIEGANDFAMMREVLARRFARREEALPQLVVVDGGKGQLAQAVAIFEELGIQGVGVVGLAKARVESDFQAKEVRSSLERVFIPNRKNPVSLLPRSKAYQLLTQLRDEAHRFAVSYHRKLRDQRSLASSDS